MNEKIVSILLDAQRNLNNTNLKTMREIESFFHFKTISDKDAVKIGECIKEAGKKYDRGLFIKIVKNNNDTIYIDFGNGTSKRNEGFADLKANTVRKRKHNSFYPLIMYALGFEDIDFFNDESILPVAGSFPLFEKNELKYIIETSGLHNGEDFKVIVEGLELYLNTSIPNYSGWLI